MIDCEKKRAPENGVEKLIARACRSFFDIVNGQEELVVSCFDSCPGNKDDQHLQDGCECEPTVYKHGSALPDEELDKNQVLQKQLCYNKASSATPLATLTALV